LTFITSNLVFNCVHISRVAKYVYTSYTSYTYIRRIYVYIFEIVEKIRRIYVKPAVYTESIRSNLDTLHTYRIYVFREIGVKIRRIYV
jgi:uncharacterized protein (UPF0305 family)